VEIDNINNCCSRCNPKITFTLDSKTKKGVSLRDGFQEYYGSELGKDYESSKLYKVYRSPETVKKASDKLNDIDITDEHVIDFDSNFNDQKIGKIRDSAIEDNIDPLSDSTIKVVNDFDYSSDFEKLLENGKREFSLGYNAKYIKSNDDHYDLEQVDIEPHHLALVERGRCGIACKVLDQKGKKNSDTIYGESLTSDDGDSKLEVKDIIEAINALEDEEKLEIKDSCFVEEEVEDEEKEEEEVIKVTDTAEFKKALDEAISEKESEIKKEMKDEESVREKAKEFLSDDYDFDGKDTLEIMKDAIATETDEDLTDEEIPIAFKLLKKTLTKEFNDSVDIYEEVGNKEY